MTWTRAKRIAVKAGIEFLVAAVVLLAAGALGSLSLDFGLGMPIHISDKVGRVAFDGAVLVLLVGWPAPFLFAAIRTTKPEFLS